MKYKLILDNNKIKVFESSQRIPNGLKFCPIWEDKNIFEIDRNINRIIKTVLSKLLKASLIIDCNFSKIVMHFSRKLPIFNCFTQRSLLFIKFYHISIKHFIKNQLTSPIYIKVLDILQP